MPTPPRADLDRLRRAAAARLGRAAGALAPAAPPGTGPQATEADLTALYRLLLGRQPDEGGWRAWMGRVQAGIPLEDLVGFFLASVEFRERLATRWEWSEGAPVPVDVRAGYRVWLRADDPSMAGVAAAGEYEPHVSARMSALLAPGAVAVDVGASWGWFSVLAGRAVRPGGAVVACEPGPQNHSVLLLNVLTNGLGDVVDIHPVAASDRAGALLYSRIGANGAVSPWSGDPAALATHDLVATTTLDQLLAGRDRVDVIKADVEGAEGLVLAGAHATLEAHRPALLLELSPEGLLAASGTSGEQLLGDLAGLGYRFEVLGPSPVAGAGPDPGAVLAAHAAAGTDHIDLVAVADRPAGLS